MKFEEAAKQAFSFLEREGFSIVTTPGQLRYESGAASVRVTWDARSGELDVLFGSSRDATASDLFSLTDVLRMEDVDSGERLMPFQIANEAKLTPFLEKLAEDTRIHARQALCGDRLYFRRLRVFRTKQAKAAMEGAETRRIRSEANSAWHAREFSRVVDLYRMIEQYLTASEKARLRYAERHRIP